MHIYKAVHYDMLTGDFLMESEQVCVFTARTMKRILSELDMFHNFEDTNGEVIAVYRDNEQHPFLTLHSHKCVDGSTCYRRDELWDGRVIRVRTYAE